MGGDHLWEAIGALGEILSAVAVLITLIYLTLQVRQSNRLMQAQHRETNRSAVLDVFDPIIRDKEFAGLIEDSRQDTSSLDTANLRRVTEQWRNELLLAQSLFTRARLFGEERTALIGANLAFSAIISHVVAREFWEAVEWDDEFEAAVTLLLEENDT